MLGELHGTSQAPAWAQRFVCAALQRGRAVTLFLEIPADEQPRLDAYLRSDGHAEAKRALVRGSTFWETPIAAQDGRGSAAMLELIDAVRLLRAQGATLVLIAFDATFEDFATRDRRMADRVRAERVRDPARVLVTYTGNVHNMLDIPGDWPPGLPTPMGSLLVDLKPVAVNLQLDAGGAAWNCTSECGVHPIAGRPPQLARGEARSRAHTVVVRLGPVTPSIPAVMRLEARRDK